MSFRLYYHPLSSYCQKVLVALYERDVPFTPELVDLMDAQAAAGLRQIWPVGKFPVLRDETADRTIPESSIIIEYVDRMASGRRPMVPDDDAACLEARLWDRFLDLYIHTPMQTIVADRLRPDGEHDPRGVDGARAALATAYGVLDRQLAGKEWVTGPEFCIADCAAAPALFYAGIVQPFEESSPAISGYFDRLLARPSFARVVEEARPYFHMFPFRDEMPARLLGPEGAA